MKYAPLLIFLGIICIFCMGVASAESWYYTDSWTVNVNVLDFNHSEGEWYFTDSWINYVDTDNRTWHPNVDNWYNEVTVNDTGMYWFAKDSWYNIVVVYPLGNITWHLTDSWINYIYPSIQKVWYFIDSWNNYLDVAFFNIAEDYLFISSYGNHSIYKYYDNFSYICSNINDTGVIINIVQDDDYIYSVSSDRITKYYKDDLTVNRELFNYSYLNISYTYNDTFTETGSTEGSTNYAGWITYVLFTISEEHNVSKIAINIDTAVGEGRLAIYSDGGNLIVESDSQELVTGWNNFTINETNLPAENYWLAAQYSSSSNYVFWTVSANSTGKRQSYGTYQAFPSSATFGDQIGQINTRIYYQNSTIKEDLEFSDFVGLTDIDVDNEYVYAVDNSTKILYKMDKTFEIINSTEINSTDNPYKIYNDEHYVFVLVNESGIIPNYERIRIYEKPDLNYYFSMQYIGSANKKIIDIATNDEYLYILFNNTLVRWSKTDLSMLSYTVITVPDGCNKMLLHDDYIYISNNESVRQYYTSNITLKAISISYGANITDFVLGSNKIYTINNTVDQIKIYRKDNLSFLNESDALGINGNKILFTGYVSEWTNIDKWLSTIWSYHYEVVDIWTNAVVAHGWVLFDYWTVFAENTFMSSIVVTNIINDIFIPFILIFLPALVLWQDWGKAGFIIGLGIGIILSVVVLSFDIGLIILALTGLVLLIVKVKFKNENE